MKLKNLFLFLIALALIYSCKKEKQEQAPEPETITLDADGLPKLTSSGLNSFGFMENDKAWWDSNEQNPNSIIARRNPRAGRFFEITFIVHDVPNSSYKYMLTFRLDTTQLAMGHTYALKLLSSGSSTVSVEKLHWDPAGNANLMISYSNNVDPSSLTVTKYDRSKRILSGTFSLKTDYFVITKGRFDLKYDIIL